MFKKNHIDLGLLILRLTAGLTMLIAHGIPKMERLFSGEEISFPDPFGVGATASLALAVFAEVVCSALISIGWLTRLALVPLLITMGFAFFDIHIADEFSRMEKSMLYGLMYVVLFLSGPGKYSVDGRFRKSLG